MLLTRARILTATLLLVSAAAFATGVALERSATTRERPAATREPSHAEAGTGTTSAVPAATTAAGDADAGNEAAKSATELGAAGESGQAAADTGVESRAAHAAEGSSESLVGVNPESTFLVVAAVLLSALLAVLVLTIGFPLVAATIAVAMLAFAVLDIREITHQLNESRPGLAIMAAVVALLHVLAGIAAVSLARADGPKRPTVSRA
jgi:hypothetical protein